MKDMCRAVLSVALSAALSAGCAGPPAASPAAGPAAGARSASAAGLLYVCNQDDATVSIVDIATRRVVETVDLRTLGFSANAKPHHAAVEPDGSHWYVSLIGEGKVVKLDRSNRVVGTADFSTPGMLALHPDEDVLWVGRSMTAVNPPARIGMIRRSDMSIEEVDVLFPRPHALVVHPGTGIAYTASLGVNQMAAVDPQTQRAVITDVEGPSHALMQFALSPDGRTLAISGEVSNTVHFFDISADPMRPRPVATVDVARQPFDPIFAPDGRTLWLGNKAADRITAIDVATHTVRRVLEDPRISEPHGVAVSPDERWILISQNNTGMVHDMAGMDADEHAAHGGGGAGQEAPTDAADRSGSVIFLDAATGDIVEAVEVGRNATGIATRR